MPVHLCFDFGNTRLKCGVFRDGQFAEEKILPAGDVAAVAELVQSYHPDKAILSSVINHPEAIETYLATHTRFHKLSHHSRLPVTTPVGKPETIGSDRLALVSAAAMLFPGHHTLAIGLGTCITFNYTNHLHQFLGGSISPGMQMRFRAMHEQTALLPEITPDMIFPLVGYDTRTNLLSGVILGMAKEIDGIIGEYGKKYRNCKAMITGGDLHFLLPHLEQAVHAEPYLLYKGLLAICEHNLP
ncbi:MAG TPA: type III pantothenate kinase [Sediminibacterium sp.]|nr:type III pantothenate kinase [Sediminibacterium sp.]